MMVNSSGTHTYHAPRHFVEHPVRGMCLHKWWLTSDVGGICGGKGKCVSVLSEVQFLNLVFAFTLILLKHDS